jgi:phenylacetate-coenzyme A ligase PaaK-like adenylate-forming protein
MESVAAVAMGGEKCTSDMRRQLYQAFVSLGADPERLRIYDGYGATEFRGGFGECFMPTGDFSSPGFHTHPDMSIIEIVDPDTGEVVPEGETGEVVYTCLDWRGSVLLRYRTADIAVGGLTTEPCPYCGATVPRISHELRRASNLKGLQLTKLKGNLVDLGTLVEYLRGIEHVEEFQIELRKQNDDPFGIDQLIVHVSISDGASQLAVREAIREETRRATEAEPNEVVIHSPQEMLDIVGAISELKQIQIVDNRPAESTI